MFVVTARKSSWKARISVFGVFSGTIHIDGEEHEIRDMPGVTEDQDIRW